MLTILTGLALLFVIFIMFIFKSASSDRRDLMCYEKCIAKSEHTEEDCRMCIDAEQCINKI
ncbi:MAG TPA: hypothetical protein DCM59_02645 [Clostridium sp.]|nr:hypothetical protein [Clostridium sp.]